MATVVGTHSMPLLYFGTKKTEEVDFSPIKKYIRDVYQEDPEHYREQVNHITQLRQDITGIGKDVKAKEILYKYFAQLEFLDLRFIIDEQHLKLIFKWFDAFTTQDMTTQHSLAFEKASVLFNLGAIYTYLGASASSGSLSTSNSNINQASSNEQNATSSFDALKKTFHYFQSAAGIFQYINDNFLHAPSTDLSRPIIEILVRICLAQAQESSLLKLLAEKKFGNLTVKIANQLSVMLSGCQDSILQEKSATKIFDSKWTLLFQVKSKHYHAVANYYKALLCEADSKHGEAIARLQLAEASAKEAIKRASGISSLSNAILGVTSSTTASKNSAQQIASTMQDSLKIGLTKISEKLKLTLKDNEVVYHDTIPNVTSLNQLEVITVAKISTLADATSDMRDLVGPDIFSKLIPLSVHETSSLYSEEKTKMIREEREKVDSANQEMMAIIASLQLPSSLSKYRKLSQPFNDTTTEVPSEVTSWSDYISQNRGVSGIDASKSDLESRKQDLLQVLEERSHQLDAEQRECEQLRVKYDDAWTQSPSASSATALRTGIKMIRDHITAASKTDLEIFSTFEQHRETIELLGKGPEQLKVYLSKPSDSVKTTNLLDVDPKDTEIKQIMDSIKVVEDAMSQLNKLKDQRKSVLDEIQKKAQNDDISSLLILNKSNEDSVFEVGLAKFKDLRQLISDNITQQNNLFPIMVQEMTQLSATESGRNIETSGKEQQAMMKQLKENGYNIFVSTKEGLKNGIKFYTELKDNVKKLENDIDSFIQARSAERHDIIRRVETSKAAQGQQQLRETLRKVSQSSSQGPITSNDLVAQTHALSLDSARPVPKWQGPDSPGQAHSGLYRQDSTSSQSGSAGYASPPSQTTHNAYYQPYASNQSPNPATHTPHQIAANAPPSSGYMPYAQGNYPFSTQPAPYGQHGAMNAPYPSQRPQQQQQYPQHGSVSGSQPYNSYPGTYSMPPPSNQPQPPPRHMPPSNYPTPQSTMAAPLHGGYPPQAYHQYAGQPPTPAYRPPPHPSSQGPPPQHYANPASSAGSAQYGQYSPNLANAQLPGVQYPPQFQQLQQQQQQPSYYTDPKSTPNAQPPRGGGGNNNNHPSLLD